MRLFKRLSLRGARATKQSKEGNKIASLLATVARNDSRNYD